MPLINSLLDQIRNNQIYSLNLKNKALTDKDITQLVQALAHNTSVETIDLSGNYITLQGLTEIRNLLQHNMTIWRIDLNNNEQISLTINEDYKRLVAQVKGAAIGGGSSLALSLPQFINPFGWGFAINYILGGITAGAAIGYKKAENSIIQQQSLLITIRQYLNNINSSIQRNIDRLINQISQNPLNFQDAQGRTALHMAVLLNSKSLIAKRVHAREDASLRDSNGRTAPELAAYLKKSDLCAIFIYKGINSNFLTIAANQVSDEFKITVTKIKDKIATANQKAASPVAELLAQATSSDNVIYSSQKLKEAYEAMLTFPEIEPLLKIAKLATLGLHRLGAQIVATDTSKPINIHDETTYRRKKTKLTILIDPASSNVEGVTLGLVRNAYGVCYYGDNRLYVGGNRNNDILLVRGTLIHEITHFIANEVFANAANPYFSHDTVSKDRLDRIVNELNSRKNNLDPLLKSVFDNYEQVDWHSEIIVRIPQLIAGKINGYQIIRDQCPALFAYYNEVFLPHCRQHLNQLREKNCLLDGQVIPLINTPILDLSEDFLAQPSEGIPQTPTNDDSTEDQKINSEDVSANSTIQIFTKLVISSTTSSSNLTDNKQVTQVNTAGIKLPSSTPSTNSVNLSNSFFTLENQEEVIKLVKEKSPKFIKHLIKEGHYQKSLLLTTALKDEKWHEAAQLMDLIPSIQPTVPTPIPS